MRRLWPSTIENSPTMLGRRWLVGEDDMEMGEINPCLLTRRHLEADLKILSGQRAHVAQKIRHGSSTDVTPSLISRNNRLPVKTGIGIYAVAVVRGERVDHRRSWPFWDHKQVLQPTLDRFARRLAVASLPDDRRHRQTLSVQIQDHQRLPQLDHQHPLPAIGKELASTRSRSSGALPEDRLRRKPSKIQTALLWSIAPD
ncbi:hypothetical protein [Mesorhizobium sp.]|uniref:hypothetical protein n=1 Tax=Mesorhizobium sp. TaxID=1871066 RepID=UPI0025BE4F08|nr:hypothetical protein [Mesorhizobium sp.]